MQRDVNYRGKFFFTRIQYDSGDWNTDQRMPINLMHSLVQYTTIAVDTEEKVVPLASDELFQSPFCYLSGHKLVQFNAKERANFKKYVENGGFVFVDDCNHDIDGLFARSFEAHGVLLQIMILRVFLVVGDLDDLDLSIETVEERISPSETNVFDK